MSDHRAIIKQFVAARTAKHAGADEAAVVAAMLEEVFTLIDNLSVIAYSLERIAVSVERMS